MVNEGDTIAVWFSCGAASAVAAKMTLRKYGNIAKIRIINNPIHEEHPDNRRFLSDVQNWLGIEIESAINKKYPSCSCVEVWEKRKGMSFKRGAPCTEELKKRARQQWEAVNQHHHLVMGFTAEEEHRHKNFALTERPNILPILIEAGLTKEDCFKIIEEAGIKLPEMYYLGYPNANCIGCVKATSPTYWNHVRRVHPEEFAKRAEQSRRLGAKLARVNNKRIYLDELDPNAQGKPMKSLKMPECGLFCEEKLLK